MKRITGSIGVLAITAALVGLTSARVTSDTGATVAAVAIASPAHTSGPAGTPWG